MRAENFWQNMRAHVHDLQTSSFALQAGERLPCARKQGSYMIWTRGDEELDGKLYCML